MSYIWFLGYFEVWNLGNFFEKIGNFFEKIGKNLWKNWKFTVENLLRPDNQAQKQPRMNTGHYLISVDIILLKSSQIDVPNSGMY